MEARMDAELKKCITVAITLWAQNKYAADDVVVIFDNPLIGWVDWDGEVGWSTELLAARFPEPKCVQCAITNQAQVRVVEHALLDPWRYARDDASLWASARATGSTCTQCREPTQPCALFTGEVKQYMAREKSVASAFTATYCYRCLLCENEWTIVERVQVDRARFFPPLD
jgi:hypothetical protein